MCKPDEIALFLLIVLTVFNRHDIRINGLVISTIALALQFNWSWLTSIKIAFCNLWSLYKPTRRKNYSISERFVNSEWKFYVAIMLIAGLFHWEEKTKQKSWSDIFLYFLSIILPYLVVLCIKHLVRGFQKLLFILQNMWMYFKFCL